jgi:ABC-2 type transport system ATP-binding protein
VTRVVAAARELRKAYGGVRALDGVTVEIAGGATGLLGANGAGKSTLLKAILGLVRPDAGSIEVLGVDVGANPNEIRRRIGYMPEHDCLPLSMQAHDFVVHMAEMRGLPRRAAVLRASEVLFQVGLEEERSRLIGTYSLGMKQRTKLAQALVHAPELVILDEPTNGLDPAGRAEMLALIHRVAHDLGVDVIISSHVLEDIRRTCDQVVVLREGRLVAAQTVAELAHGEDTGLVVRTSERPEALVALLRERGIGASLDATLGVRTPASDAATRDAVRDAVAELGCGLRSLGSGDHAFEDALVTAIESGSALAAAESGTRTAGVAAPGTDGDDA